MTENVYARLQLGLQAAVFGAAKHVQELGSVVQAQLLTAERDSLAACARAAQENGQPDDSGVPALVLRGANGDGGMLTFGSVGSDYCFAGGIPGLPQDQQNVVRQYMNSMIARARGVWAQWAAENNCPAALNFDTTRLVLQFEVNGQKVNHSLGFVHTVIDGAPPQ
jgi:hypothetical protein